MGRSMPSGQVGVGAMGAAGKIDVEASSASNTRRASVARSSKLRFVMTILRYVSPMGVKYSAS